MAQSSPKVGGADDVVLAADDSGSFFFTGFAKRSIRALEA
jgi:hypothetical protein